MINQLLLVKRLYLEATHYAVRTDAISSGIAISMFQDAAELMLWTLIKARGIGVKEESSFTANLDQLRKDGFTIPEASGLRELNKARVGFKHYGNLPATNEVAKHQGYVEGLIRNAVSKQFGVDIDQLSLSDLVTFEDVRLKLKEAELHVEKAEYQTAVRHSSIAKVMLFTKLSKHIPAVDRSLSTADRRLAVFKELGNFKAFSYVTSYLDMLRDLSIISLLRIPLSDYTFLQMTLFPAVVTMGGQWQTNATRVNCTAEECKRQIECLVSISLRLDGVT